MLLKGCVLIFNTQLKTYVEKKVTWFLIHFINTNLEWMEIHTVIYGRLLNIWVFLPLISSSYTSPPLYSLPFYLHSLPRNHHSLLFLYYSLPNHSRWFQFRCVVILRIKVANENKGKMTSLTNGGEEWSFSHDKTVSTLQRYYFSFTFYLFWMKMFSKTPNFP